MFYINIELLVLQLTCYAMYVMNEQINIDELCRLSGISEEDRVEISKPGIVSIASMKLKQLLESTLMDMKNTDGSNSVEDDVSGGSESDRRDGMEDSSKSIKSNIYLAVTDGPQPAYFTSVTIANVIYEND